jgi:hypothetical protein
MAKNEQKKKQQPPQKEETTTGFGNKKLEGPNRPST